MLRSCPHGGTIVVVDPEHTSTVAARSQCCFAGAVLDYGNLAIDVEHPAPIGKILKIVV
ncbi:hypothetical protein L195_g019561 [Trifolium pratense]|uniref:Uncharacterized protein n=1 Tax=Trifolium pratense TaxID=57577 RepID=A0A2K3N009_TRIPR|nr:hypothetical protein L195_g019561 [Trifolium pratense]